MKFTTGLKYTANYYKIKNETNGCPFSKLKDSRKKYGEEKSQHIKTISK